MTWKDLRDAVEAWGIRDEDVLAGVRLNQYTQGVGIRRTDHGVEIVSLGTLFPPAEDLCIWKATANTPGTTLDASEG
jgi:hypothetical protein